MGRKSKIFELSEVVNHFIKRGQIIGIGGQYLHNNPMEVVREIIRQNLQIRVLVTSVYGSINADMLIGAGLIEELISPFVGLEHLGLAPNFRRSVEEGRIKLHECDEAFIVFGLLAGAGRIPFIPYPEGVFPSRNDILNVPKSNEEDYKVLQDPFTKRNVFVIKGINLDIAIIHCQLADSYGNGIFIGATFMDYQMIQAADKSILMVEEIISNEEFINYPNGFKVPGFLVDAVVKVPFGCHPTSSHGFYNYDDLHLKEYRNAGASEDEFKRYLEKYVTSLSSEIYFEKVGGERLLNKLAAEGK